MNRDDIIRLARDVGAHATNFNGRWTFYMGELELFAAIVAAAEREACEADNAKLREELAEARRDAERYRWLRDECTAENQQHTWILEAPPEDWDAAIDAAMKGEKE